MDLRKKILRDITEGNPWKNLGKQSQQEIYRMNLPINPSKGSFINHVNQNLAIPTPLFLLEDFCSNLLVAWMLSPTHCESSSIRETPVAQISRSGCVTLCYQYSRDQRIRRFFVQIVFTEYLQSYSNGL